ncbi:MAG: hypothetical protein AAGI71_05155 [Bacteroidota bacterium]
MPLSVTACRPRALFFATLLVLAGTGCATSSVNTLPPLVGPEAATEHVTLYVPEGLDIQSVDLEADVFSEAKPGTHTIISEIGGRSFVKAYAVERETGVQVLLVYENIAERPKPIQIIRFETESASLGQK